MSFYTLIDLEWTSWKNNYYGKHLEKAKKDIVGKKRNYSNWWFKI